MPTILNCEGEPCPNPVLRCKRLLDSDPPEQMQVIVDNDAAKENVSRFLASKGMRIDDMRKDGGLWTITASRAAQPGRESGEPAPATRPEGITGCPVCVPKILVFITRDVIGQGDDVLGSRLMGNFLATLPELGDALWRIILVNGAVKLATSSNPAMESLKKLEDSGVSILVCGTCLEFFNLMGEKALGEVTNMLDVVTSQQVADKVITI
jgi:selenium metabolism protein YedF